MSEISVIAADFGLLIVTATLLSVLAQRTGQPKIVAYIVTGLVLGPVGLHMVSETPLIELLSELGLAFLLFLIGIEMDFDEIRDILSPVFRIAVLQTVLQTALAFAVAYALGFTLMETVILALATVFGSTPVVVKLLADKDEASTVPGRLDIGVLLVQDLYLVIVLAVLGAPVLGSPAAIATSLGKIVVLVGVIGGLSYAASRYVLPGHFQRVADAPNIFFIHGVAWALLFISVSQYLDIPVEVGAFLAGLGLGQIQYREEMRERIRPLTDFFMVIFFASIGLSLTMGSLLQYWREAVAASAFMMAGNFLIMFYLIDREKFSVETSFKGSINMTQVSEFSLVVGALAVSRGFIGAEVLGYLSLMALLTMGGSSYLINYNDVLYNRYRHLLEFLESEEKSDAEVKRFGDHAIIAGYNDIARHIVPVLKEHVDEVVVVDRNPHRTAEARELDVEYIFGDFKHRGIRESAGIDRARIIISFSEEIETGTKILEERGPDTVVFVRATTREEAGELYGFGADYILRKNALAADQFAEHLERYLEDRDGFASIASETRERLKEWDGDG